MTSKNPHAQALGRLGGRKGGEARRDALTPERRLEISQIASKAAAEAHKARAKARRKAESSVARQQK